MKKRNYLYLTLILGVLLGCYEGHLALFQTGHSLPIRVYEQEVRFLPEADQALVTRGIPVASREQLAYLLEDYLS